MAAVAAAITPEDNALPDALNPLRDLVACPQCDTLHNATRIPAGTRAHCKRCGVLLVTQNATAFAQVLSLAMTAFVMMLAAISFPFLKLSVAGHSNSISVLQAVMAFNDGVALLLAFAVAGFIVFLPLLRLSAIIYAIGPLARDMPPRPLAKQAFGLAEALRPWSMAEIFIVGVTVALVKVAGLATVTMGPAFWAFCGLVVVTILKDQLICRYSIWQALE
ncbi:paraquat-inducible protein A [Yoonia sp. MH D7]